MTSDQLEDRLTRSADALPDPASATIEQVQARAAARRTHRRAVVAALAIPAIGLAGVVVPELLRSSGDVPIISAVDEPNREPQPRPTHVEEKPAGAAPDVVAGPEKLLDVEAGGVTRALTVWRRSDGIVCVELLGTSCIRLPEDGEVLGARLSSSSEGRGQAAIRCDSGAVGASVATVTLRYLGGDEVDAQIADASEVGGRYYAHCGDLERGRPAISFYDAQGEELHPPR